MILNFVEQGHISTIRHGLVVRIAGSHPAGPGSIPGVGNLFCLLCPSGVYFWPFRSLYLRLKIEHWDIWRELAGRNFIPWVKFFFQWKSKGFCQNCLVQLHPFTQPKEAPAKSYQEISFSEIAYLWKNRKLKRNISSMVFIFSKIFLLLFWLSAWKVLWCNG